MEHPGGKLPNQVCTYPQCKTGNGHGWYGGVYVAAMYSLAYVSDDVEYVVTEALRSIPRESRFHACMADVINWHKQYPEDWKKCWEEIEKKWGSNDIACPDGVEMPFNIETHAYGDYTSAEACIPQSIYH